MNLFRAFVALAAAAIAATNLTACEPPPPRLHLTVTTTVAGSDDDPGDGTCHSTSAGGCSLQAAIAEGNTGVDGADITIPPGDYAAFAAGVTGDVRIAAATPASTRLGDSGGVQLTVLPGGRLEITDLNTGGVGFPWPFHVNVGGGPRPGIFIARRSVLSAAHGVTPVVPLLIDEPGVAVLVDSLVHSPEYESVVNHGTLIAGNSSLLTSFTFTALRTTGWTAPAQSSLRGSAIARFDVFPGDGGGCRGGPPISHGYVHIEDPCGSEPNPTDGEGNAGYHISDTFRPHLDPTSPLVDAIPITDPACDTTSLDLYGNPRGVDGNGDGLPGCDIGAIERQPVPAA